MINNIFTKYVGYKKNTSVQILNISTYLYFHSVINLSLKEAPEWPQY